MNDDICKNYHKGNRYSTEAYQSIRKPSERYRLLIFDMIRKSSGITCEEIELQTGWKHQTVSARISELKRDGKIFPWGKRKTTSGRSAAVYFTVRR